MKYASDDHLYGLLIAIIGGDTHSIWRKISISLLMMVDTRYYYFLHQRNQKRRNQYRWWMSFFIFLTIDKTLSRLLNNIWLFEYPTALCLKLKFPWIKIIGVILHAVLVEEQWSPIHLKIMSFEWLHVWISSLLRDIYVMLENKRKHAAAARSR